MPVGILAVVPVELHPLVPEGEGVHLQTVTLDLLDKVGRSALIIPPLDTIRTTLNFLPGKPLEMLRKRPGRKPDPGENTEERPGEHF